MSTGFTIHTPETAPETSKALLAKVQKGWGFIPKLQATMAESPETLEAHEALFALVPRMSLTPQEQQAVFLTVSVFHECEYCASAHTHLGRLNKLDEAAIQALRNGTPIPDARLQALRHFTEAVLRARGFAGDAAVAAFLAAGYTRRNVLEVVTVIATKTITNYTNHLTHTPKESFMLDPALAWTSPRNRVEAA